MYENADAILELPNGETLVVNIEDDSISIDIWRKTKNNIRDIDGLLTISYEDGKLNVTVDGQYLRLVT